MYTLFLLNAVQGFILWLQLNKFFFYIVLGKDIFYKVPGDSCKFCTVIMLIGKFVKVHTLETVGEFQPKFSRLF